MFISMFSDFLNELLMRLLSNKITLPVGVIVNLWSTQCFRYLWCIERTPISAIATYFSTYFSKTRLPFSSISWLFSESHCFYCYFFESSVFFLFHSRSLYGIDRFPNDLKWFNSKCNSISFSITLHQQSDINRRESSSYITECVCVFLFNWDYWF